MQTTAPILYIGTICGTPITKKNSNRIVTGRNGRQYVVPSAQFEKYQKLALPQLAVPPEPISCPCNVSVEYHVPDLIRRDLVNLLAGTCDILVAAGVLEDDNWKIVASHDGSKVVVDRADPRAVIVITAREDINPWWKKPKATRPKSTGIDAPPPPAAQNIM